MTLTPVKTLPKHNLIELRETSAPKKKRKDILDDFIAMNVKFARLNFADYEYKNTRSAYESLCQGVRTYGHPIKIYKHGTEIYFVRKDI